MTSYDSYLIVLFKLNKLYCLMKINLAKEFDESEEINH